MTVHFDGPAPASAAGGVAGAQLRQQSSRNRVLLGPPLRVVCLGGGTGLPTVLRGLARRVAPTLAHPGLELTAVVAMSDDGGSSGRLRRSRGMLPPGDVRNCLLALAGEGSGLKELFGYRFGGARASGLAGHAVGNLVLSALAELKGDFLEAVDAAGRLLHTRGRVLPSTVAHVQLAAELDDDTVVVGERRIARSRRRVRRVSLSPRAPAPAAGVLEAIASADLITLGPGSLYSSVLPNLLVGEVAEALRASPATKVLIANLMTQPGETDGMSCADHVRALHDHVGPLVDVVLFHGAPLSPQALARYAGKGAAPVVTERDELMRLGVVPVSADLVKPGARVRHDSYKLTRCLLRLAPRVTSERQ